MQDPQSTGQLSAQAARRLAAATQRVNAARRAGPKETVEALRAVLLSALKLSESPQPVLDDVAAYVLARLPAFYGTRDGA